MGGNVSINGIEADRIHVNVGIELVEDLQVFRDLIGDLYPSGSTRFLFDENIRHVKDTYGDIDLQVDIESIPHLAQKLETDMVLGNFRLIGWKRATNTIVTLWRYRGKLNVQVDLEGVEFEANAPTEWSRFAYYACSNDAQNDLKGVAHKYIFRALTACWVDDFPIKRGSKIKVEKMNRVAFSNRGLRFKVIPDVYHTHWYILKPSESEYIINIERIFKLLINHEVEFQEQHERLMWSYIGVVSLIRDHMVPEVHCMIADAMAELLWGRSAQQIEKDSDEDMLVKQRIMLYLSSALNIDRYRWDSLIKQYYGTFQNN